WRLYDANRSPTLRPDAVGHHGETVSRLLRPGFHSGTVPKVYARLRRAVRRGNHKAFGKQRETLHELIEAVRHFIERELVTLLDRSPSWGRRPLKVSEIVLGLTRIRISLRGAGVAEDELTLALEEQSGWLMARILKLGWLAPLSETERQPLLTALVGL